MHRVNHRVWGLAILILLNMAVPSLAAASPPSTVAISDGETAVEVDEAAPLAPISPVFLQDGLLENYARGAEESEQSYGDGQTDEEPAHIRDNAFLVEEAFNQEPGVVQHIFNWIQVWDSTATGRTRDFVATYTMELPLGSQAHQFSFTVQSLDGFEKPDGSPPEHQGGIGDTFLNYRYQLLADDDFLWCAPRFSLIVPTGDERFGLGNGEVGYQLNLPVSRYGERFDAHFNAGYTITPGVSAHPALPLIEHDLQGFNLGGSTFWKPRVNLHLFVEALALWSDEIDDFGGRTNVSQVFVNPGARYAVCQFEEVEWVLGVSVPVGLTADTPNIGVFAYMSVEHAFRKIAD